MSLLLCSASLHAKKGNVDPFWQNAVVYFMLTDRFNNGNSGNDLTLDRGTNGAVLRNFMGGDISGVTQKLEAGYFNDLGVDAIWMTPVNEQIHGYWEDDWGDSYPFHGYWPKDWTAVDPNFGTEAEMAKMIDTAHEKGIRVLVDVIVNHTGPKTKRDEAWPASWVRTKPQCDWNKNNFANTVPCTIAASLTDIRTESDEPVELPEFLLEKWRQEGRLDKELSELDAFFKRTELPRAPKNYIIKWLVDWVRDYGVDGFRVDTAKHVEPEVWTLLKKEASHALAEWKAENPEKAIDDKPFFMVGEVYNFGLDGFENTVKGTTLYNYGDRTVDFYDYGFDSLINMSFSKHAVKSTPELFELYASELSSAAFQGKGILNYVVSHDDPMPYDRDRSRAHETAEKLMLAPGAVQIYYGDELARPLFKEGAIGDAHWRVPMNWEDLKNPVTQKLLTHWQQLGQFRKRHQAIGAGRHVEIQKSPYVFGRVLDGDAVVVALGQSEGAKEISIGNMFKDGMALVDAYSGTATKVENGRVKLATAFTTVLLEPVK